MTSNNSKDNLLAWCAVFDHIGKVKSEKKKKKSCSTPLDPQGAFGTQDLNQRISELHFPLLGQGGGFCLNRVWILQPAPFRNACIVGTEDEEHPFHILFGFLCDF